MAKGELKPASKPGSRRGSLNPDSKEEGSGEWSWDRESTPLKPRGEGPAKFIDKPCDKWSGTEKETIYAMLEVFGDPVPTVQWFKGFKDLRDEGQRFKIWTDGATNQAVLGIEGLKQEDEGAYRCVLDNGNGEVEHEFSVYVTGRPIIISSF